MRMWTNVSTIRKRCVVKNSDWIPFICFTFSTTHSLSLMIVWKLSWTKHTSTGMCLLNSCSMQSLAQKAFHLISWVVNEVLDRI